MSEAPVPVLLVAGFLGAGKTTVVNHLLAHAGGRRIAAVVNDFGAVGIDAELIAQSLAQGGGGGGGADDGVVSLANGCICCSLEGDLLRTLATLLRRRPRPETIVIETSGIADPADIVRNLMDPVIWREAPLETVLCVVDATAAPGAFDDALLRSQVRSADVVALTKTDLADAAAEARARAAVAALAPRAVLVEAVLGQVPATLLFPDGPARPAAVRDPGRNPGRDPGRDWGRDPGRRRPVADRFESLSWTSAHPLSLPRLQQAIGRLAPKLARAKGAFETVEQPGRPMLFQFAAGRATLAPFGAPFGAPPGTASAGSAPARMVFIAEIGVLSAAEVEAAMEACVVTA